MVQQTEISQCDTHINKRKEKKKKNTIFSIYVEKAFDKIQHPLTVIKKYTLTKVGIEEPYLNIIQAIYDKTSGIIRVNGKKLKVFSKNSRTRKRCAL